MAFKLFTNKRHHCVHVAPGIIWLYLAGPIHPHLYSFTHHFPSGPLSFFFPPSHLLVPTRSLPLSFCAPSAHHIPLSLCSVSYPPPKLGPIEIIQASNPNSHFCHRISANKQLLPVSVDNYCLRMCNSAWSLVLQYLYGQNKTMLSQSVSNSTSQNMTFLIDEKHTAWCLGKI